MAKQKTEQEWEQVERSEVLAPVQAGGGGQARAESNYSLEGGWQQVGVEQNHPA